MTTLIFLSKSLFTYCILNQILSVPGKELSMLMCPHPTSRCTDQSISGGLHTASLIEIFGLLLITEFK